MRSALRQTDFSQIVEMDRAQIVDDVFSLAEASKQDLAVAMRVSSFLENDVEYFPWAAAFRKFESLLRRYTGSSRSKLEVCIQFHVQIIFLIISRKKFVC